MPTPTGCWDAASTALQGIELQLPQAAGTIHEDLHQSVSTVKPDPHLVLSGFCLVPGSCVLALHGQGETTKQTKDMTKRTDWGGGWHPVLATST